MQIKKTLLFVSAITFGDAAYDDFFGNKWSATFVAPTHTVTRTPDMITWEETGIVYRGKTQISVKNIHLNQKMDLFQFASILGEDEEFMDVMPPEAHELLRIYQDHLEDERELNSRPIVCSPIPSEDEEEAV